MNGLYQVSNLGRVKSLYFSKEKILTAHISKGYQRIGLSKNGKQTLYYIHVLVAKAFVTNPLNLPEVNHKDENKLNNEADNLEWCTAKYNTYYSMHEDTRVYCFDLDEEFASASVAAVHTGTCRSSIVKACRGQLSHAGGKLWCYSKDKNQVFPK